MARIHRRNILKDLNNPGNHAGVMTHLDTDILECKVKWALGSFTTNKANRGDGIPAELLQILKDAETMETVRDFIFLDSKITADGY